MQIYEVTTPKSLNEISWNSIKQGAKKLGQAAGKGIAQAPYKALGRIVGADLLPDVKKTKSATELMYDMQKYFGFAKQQLYQGMPEHVILSELIGKYGANQEQAKKALEAAHQQLQSAPQAGSQAGSQAFGTMANQLGQADNAPAPTPIPANPAVPNTNYQMPTGMQTTNNAKTTMASPASATPPPTNLPIPKYNTATPPASAPTTAATIPTKPEPISIGKRPGETIKPNDPLYAKIQQQLAKQKSAEVAESLTWSRRFDPSATLLKKIKQL